MSELNSGRAKAWSIIYSNSNINSNSNSSNTTNPPTPIISEAGDVNKEGPWKSLGSSMNAISFGFVATAILISMFLIMAIFEHLFRPNESSSSSSSHDHSRSTQMHKLNGSPQLEVQTAYGRDISVVMPGEQQPRFIGQPTPLACAREGVHWPSHLINLQS